MVALAFPCIDDLREEVLSGQERQGTTCALFSACIRLSLRSKAAVAALSQKADDKAMPIWHELAKQFLSIRRCRFHRQALSPTRTRSVLRSVSPSISRPSRMAVLPFATAIRCMQERIKIEDVAAYSAKDEIVILIFPTVCFLPPHIYFCGAGGILSFCFSGRNLYKARRCTPY